MPLPPIIFPGLNLSFNVQPEALVLGSFVIRWYGICIALGLLLALLYGMRRAKVFNVSADDLADIVIISMIAGIIGARVYYILFDPYRQAHFPTFASYFTIWEGGLGIYGGLIASFLAAFIVCRFKKISTGAVFDLAGLGFLIGQAVGRWGNFFNREAYGHATSSPLRMVIDSTDSTSVGYHPCFLYESVWCLLGFVLLHIYSKRRKFNGQIFLMYVMWYGLGRFFIEGLREDSLMFYNVRVSQIVAAVSFAAALALMIYKLVKLPRPKTDDSAYTPVYGDAIRALREEETARQEQDEEDGRSDEMTEDEITEEDENPPADEASADGEKADGDASEEDKDNKADQ